MAIIFFCNLLYSLFSVFSLALVIPFLGVLFGTSERVFEPVPYELKLDSVLHNFSYLLTSIIESKGEVTALAYLCIGIVLMFFMKNFFAYMSHFFLSPVTNGIVYDLRKTMFAKILALPIGYYSDEKKGDIISRITSDVNEVEISVLRSFDMLFKEPVLIIFYLSTLVILNPTFTLFIIGMLIIVAFIIGGIGKTLRKTSAQVQKKLGEILSVIEETLGGLKVIKAFNAEDKINSKFKNLGSSYLKTVIGMWRRRDLASPMSEFLGALVIISVVFYGGQIVLDGKMEPQSLIGYLIVFSQMLNPTKSFSQSYYNVLKGYASIERIEKIMGADNTIVDVKDPQNLDTFKDKIVYENVSFKYGNDYVLKNINLEIRKGQTIALVGKSGSGKSTLADLLPRFWDVQEGSIYIDGIPIKNISLKSLRALMGIVTQEPVLFNDTFAGNISLGVDKASIEDIIKASEIANAHEFIADTPGSYNFNVGDRANKLSGGQRQRLSIARAILKNPPIMILDEATSALDTESERLVQEAIINLMKNRTSLVIAHRLSTIKYADLICVLDEGEIVERGTHDDLMKLNGFYKRLHDMQMH